tara:strand:- start:269 stop:634 length:366 start_codon:yes stop_codon:yes gene_type:complete
MRTLRNDYHNDQFHDQFHDQFDVQFDFQFQFDVQFLDFLDFQFHDFQFHVVDDKHDRPELARMRRDGAGNSRLDDHFPTFRDPGNGNIYEGHRLLPVQQRKPRGNGQVHYLVVVLEQVAGD